MTKFKKKLTSQEFATGRCPTWCPGCGDNAIWAALRSALAALNQPPEKVVVVYGIGCSGNMANFIRSYGFHGLHGRAVPVAEAVKIANPELTVIVVGGDGDGLGEGLNHFIHSVRGNHDITYLLLDNRVYGLTTGQTSPTSAKGFISKSTPAGSIEVPINPLALAISAGGTFVARGFAGELPHLTNLIMDAVTHRGFSFIDILQPCVTFNHMNTYEGYYKNLEKLDPSNHQEADLMKAFEKAQVADKLPIGVFYRNPRPAYHEEIMPKVDKPRALEELAVRPIDDLIAEFR